MKKKMLVLFGCLLMVSNLSGCWSIQETPAVTSATFPPLAALTAAPTDDQGLRMETSFPMYLPAADGERLVAQMAPVTLTFGTSNAEAVLRALFDFDVNPTVRPVSLEDMLKLDPEHPVAVSGGVAMVNLVSETTNFQAQSLFNTCASIAATLTQLEEIQHVSVTLNGKAIGMDNRNLLPLGTLSEQKGTTLLKQWEALRSQQVPLGYQSKDVPLYAAVTLFFPLTDGSGIMPEVRNLAFPGQELSQQVSVLMEALSGGAATLGDITPPLHGSSMLSSTPVVVTDALSTADRRVILHFTSDVAERLAAENIDFVCYLGSVVNTLTSFIPSVSSAEVLVGDDPLTQMTHPALGTLSVEDGIVTQAMFRPLLSQSLSLYVPVNGVLKTQVCTLVGQDAMSPRRVLEKLFEVLSQPDGLDGSGLPEPMGKADIIGLSMADGLLKVNLSGRAATLIASLSPEEEQLLAYAMVNTLHYVKTVKRVAFFFDGEQRETLAGHVLWSGTFLFAPWAEET